MVAALMGLYFFLVWLIFKKLGVAWTKNRTIGVVVAGFLVLLVLILGWKISAPTVPDGAIVTGPVLQMRTQVGGRVVKVWVTDPRPVKRGEPLFQIDPEPYRLEMELSKAALEQSKRDVAALGEAYKAAVAAEETARRHIATLNSAHAAATATVATTRDQILEARQDLVRAKANVDKARSSSEAAVAQVEMAREAFKTNAVSKLQLTDAERIADAAAASVVAAKAGAAASRVRLEKTLMDQLAVNEAKEQQAKHATSEAESSLVAASAQARELKTKLDSTIEGEHTMIRQARRRYQLAEWNLEQTMTRAPLDGYIITTVLRPGSMVRALDQAMTLISSEDSWIVAQVPQYLSDFVAEGNPVDITFTMYPGLVVQGVVTHRLWASGAAQVSSGGEIPDPRQITDAGPYAVRISVSEMPADHPIRFGAVCTASIYTGYWAPFVAIQKMVINMSSWMNYLG